MKKVLVLALLLFAGIASAQGTAVFVGISDAHDFGFDWAPYAQLRSSGQNIFFDVTLAPERKLHATSGYTASANATLRASLSGHLFAGIGVYHTRYRSDFKGGSDWSKMATVPQAEVGLRFHSGEISLSYKRGPSHWGYVSTSSLQLVSLVSERHISAQLGVDYSDHKTAMRMGVGYRF